MPISIDHATRVISVPQSYLTLVSGTLYKLDSNQFRKDVMAELADETHIFMPDAFIHNTEVTIAGVTYARTIEFINGYSITFENTGSAYSVRIEGSNNNIFDVDNGILNPTPLVTVISTNSAGLVNVDGGTAQAVWEYILTSGDQAQAELIKARLNAGNAFAVSASKD